MIRSMTGYGRGEYTDDIREINIQVKSLNHRYRDVSVRMSKRYSFAEEKIKNIVKEYSSRGKIEISVSIESSQGVEVELDLDLDLTKQYYEKMRLIQSKLDVVGDIPLTTLAQMPEVLTLTSKTDDEESLLKDLENALRMALEDFNAMRLEEGSKLKKDIDSRKSNIIFMLERIEEIAPSVPLEYGEKLRERINALLSDEIDLSEEKLASELAYFADKSNIDEEIVRLKSHLSQLDNILTSKDFSLGKKIDFLIQELNREANTIGSKANNLEITNLVLEMKNEIEKIREQVQNIE